MSEPAPARQPRRVDYVPSLFSPGGHQREWACDPPPGGIAFEVVRDEWNEAGDVRVIHEWRPA